MSNNLAGQLAGVIIGVEEKTPGEVEKYGIDWTDWLADCGTGYALSGSTWTAERVPPSGTTVAVSTGDKAPTYSTTGTTVHAEGGVRGDLYYFHNVVTATDNNTTQTGHRIIEVRVI